VLRRRKLVIEALGKGLWMNIRQARVTSPVVKMKTKAAGDQGTEQGTADDDSASASDAAADQASQQSESPPASEYVPSEGERSTSE
jgi:hypothetical protein